MHELLLVFQNRQIKIKQKDGLYCLNDLHRAYTTTDEKKPNDWIKRNIQGSVKGDKCPFLLNRDKSRLLHDESTNIEIRTVKGRSGGTYSNLAGVYAYAQYLDKTFADAVNAAFTALATGDVRTAQAIAESITIPPELVQRYKDTKACLDEMLVARGLSSAQQGHAHSNYYRLAVRAATGYTPAVLTAGTCTATDWISQQHHPAAYHALIAAMENIITALNIGVTDYHKIAAMLQVQTNKNSSYLILTK